MSAHAVDRRQLLGAAAGAGLLALSGSSAIAAEPVFTPERYGAKGDGRSDDSAAFARLSDAVNAAGGGTIVLRRTTYLVGKQGPGVDLAAGTRLLSFLNCHRALTIRGNGATLRCAPGQRFGMFRPDGSPTPEIVSKGQEGMARPYAAMIEAKRCSGGVLIEHIELDGNSGAHILGGQRGDKGWQIGCAGVALRENSGPEWMNNVWSHHQPQDGFYVNGVGGPTPGVERHFVNIKADMNGRQGLSIVGGQDYRIERSSFTRTGRGKVKSAPGAGVDIEPHHKKQARNLVFVDCKFMDNRGCGLVADSGDSADVSFAGCTFVGTDNWSVWHDKPGFRFDRCTFAGSLVHAFGSPDPARATRFTQCVFTDDPALSPTGKLDLKKSRASNFGPAENVLFDRCRFRMIRDGMLPISQGAIYRDCTMSQQARQPAAMQARFEGRNVITGPVDLKASVITGETILNGAPVARTARA
jgi:hypothetical protein